LNRAAEAMELDPKTVRKLRSGTGIADDSTLEKARQYIESAGHAQPRSQ
jgi:hypothetical protein